MMVMIKLAWRLVYHTCYHCVHERDFLFFHLIKKCSVKIVIVLKPDPVIDLIK